MAKPEILIVGGGMITHDQLLPALYHMQRQDRVGEISICGLKARDLQPLVSAVDASSKVMNKRLWSSHAGELSTWCTKPGSQALMAATPLG